MKNLPEELFSAYLDGELSAEEQAQIERLLATSTDARQLLEELRSVSQSLQRLPMHHVKEDLAAKVLQEAQRRKTELPAEAPGRAIPMADGAVAGPSAAVAPASEPAVSAPELGLPKPGFGLPKEAVSAHPATGAAESAAGARASAPAARPTTDIQSGRGILAGAPAREAAGWQWSGVLRRLVTSRGLIWSAVAVLVAAAIWWFGPPRSPIQQVAQAPKDSAKFSEHPDAHFPEQADREALTALEAVSKAEGELLQRTGPTGAAIRARSAHQPPATAEEAKEKRWLLAESRQPAKEALQPSVDRAGAAGVPAAQVGPESLSKRPSWDGVREGLPKTAPLEGAMARPAEAPAPALKAEPIREPSPSVGLAETGKAFGARGQGAAGAAATDVQAPAKPAGKQARPAGVGLPAQDGEQAIAKESMEAGAAKLLAKGPAGGAGAPSPSAPVPALVAPGAKPLRKAPEPPQPEKPPDIAQKGLIPSTAAIAKKESALGAAEAMEADQQTLPPLLADTTLVVVCDLTASALRQQVFEQILSSQEILLADGEDVLEDLEADFGVKRLKRTDAGFSAPGKPSQAEKPAASASKDVSQRPAGRPDQPTTKSQEALANIAKSSASFDRGEQRAARASDKPGQSSAGLGQPASETQLQFVLVEASPEQLEGALRAIQARPEEFLAVSVSPAPADPSQQIYQQYNRAYRARGLKPAAGQAAPAGETPSAAQALLPDQSPSVRRSALQGHAKPLAAGNAVASAPAPAKESATPPPVESAKQKSLPEKGREAGPGLTAPPSPAAPSKLGAETEMFRQQPLQQTLPMGQQQAWARRLRLPEHLSQQFTFGQQAQFRQQAGLEGLAPSLAPLSAQAGQHPAAPVEEQKAMPGPPSEGPSASKGRPLAPAPPPPSKPPSESKPAPPLQERSEGLLPGQAPSAKPVPAKPPRPLEQAPSDTRQDSDAPPQRALAAPAQSDSVPSGAPGAQAPGQAKRIRVLFVLRPAESAP